MEFYFFHITHGWGGTHEWVILRWRHKKIRTYTRQSLDGNKKHTLTKLNCEVKEIGVRRRPKGEHKWGAYFEHFKETLRLLGEIFSKAGKKYGPFFHRSSLMDWTYMYIYNIHVICYFFILTYFLWFITVYSYCVLVYRACTICTNKLFYVVHIDLFILLSLWIYLDNISVTH